MKNLESQPTCGAAVRSSDLLGLVTELLNMLETVEESDNGNEFHPTTIQTCRCMHAAKLDQIMPKITAIVRQSPNARTQRPGASDAMIANQSAPPGSLE